MIESSKGGYFVTLLLFS